MMYLLGKRVAFEHESMARSTSFIRSFSSLTKWEVLVGGVKLKYSLALSTWSCISLTFLSSPLDLGWLMWSCLPLWTWDCSNCEDMKAISGSQGNQVEKDQIRVLAHHMANSVNKARNIELNAKAKVKTKKQIWPIILALSIAFYS